jgi:(1->4)-alpha-D-glucan 1-alpha-D-glucosylmutase
VIPHATYRLQFHAGFTFEAAADQAGYLARLGISHVYASPIGAARKGSPHGYDVIDPTSINPELGGEEGFRDLCAALRREGLGVLLDIVPNHMAVGGADNAWWLDVLEKGRSSDFAGWFDIDWDPPDPALAGKVAAPFLGAPYAEALAAGDIVLRGDGADLSAWAYGHHRFPIRAEDRREVLAAGLDAFAPRSPDGRARLHALLENQHWRLAWWRTAGDEINWRRFFDITELAALRIEHAPVFEAVHALPLRLYDEGLIDGLRVDHVDGLADPGGYCRRLRAELEARRPGGWLLVEKILAAGEILDPGWGCDGETGYAFMDQVGALLHDPAGADTLTQLWTGASGRTGDFHREERQARLELLDRAFAGQLRAAARAFHRLARADVATRDLTEAGLERSLRALLAAFPAYRTYAQGKPASAADRQRLAAALAGARAHLGPGEAPIAEQVVAWLSGEGGEPTLMAEAARRFQQLSAPLAAKSVEDTALYRYGRVLSRNEVGADPARLSLRIDGFHGLNAARADALPRSLIATATHDHKRGEDVRARLAVLSEMAPAWSEAVDRWRGMNDASSAGVDGGDELQLYQTLVGAWPVGLDPRDSPGLAAWRERVWTWWRKALREAKLRSSWAAPDEAYEAACEAWLRRLIEASDAAGFRAEVARVIDAMEPAARSNGIVQAFLKCVSPGIPDIYQGCEFRDLSLVDPDNRRPVDFAVRRRALDSVGAAEAFARGDFDAAKQAVIASSLAARRDHAPAFEGDYTPVPVSGARAGHVVAFRRGEGTEAAICAAVVRTAGGMGQGSRLPPTWWGDTAIHAGAPWRDPLSGHGGEGGATPAAAVFEALPVALLLPSAPADGR